MKYDFDKVTNRRGTRSVKWDISKEDDVIPLWVADMDFPVAPAIQQAIRTRAEHPVFGYALVPESYYEAVINWFKRRHRWTIERSWISYTTGVVPATSCAIKALAMPGEKVLIQSPAYNCFFSSIINQGCQIVENPLRRKGDSYEIDYEHFEQCCADEKTAVFLLCNPHNPSGRVWTREELEHMNAICMKHNVVVVSDEIHCELVMPGYEYTPFASVSEDCLNNSVTLNSPSKSFNIAGLQVANIICKNPVWHRRIERAINIFEVCDVNPFASVALEAAYNESEQWIDELNVYIHDNYTALKDFFREYLPKLEVLRMEGTYLVWVDISSIELTSDEAAELLLKEGKVMVNSGTMYGKQTGQGYLRINIACPRATLMEGLKRIGRVLSPYMEETEDYGCPM